MPLFKHGDGSDKSPSPSARNSQLGDPAAAPPPAYNEAPVHTVDGVETPIDLAAAFANLRLTSAASDPDTDKCLAHLKLLAAFQNMKEDMGYADGLWDIWDTRADNPEVYGDVEKQPLADGDGDAKRSMVLSRLREKRWALFVARAVDRYEAWWTAMFRPSLDEKQMLFNFSPSFEAFPTCDDAMHWTESMLPPLDVLMVMHSHMLNPRSFLEDAMRYGARAFWKTGLPWPEVNRAIDTAFNYRVSDDSKAAWVALTGRSWNNMDDPMTKTLKCPACNNAVSIPWTTCALEEHPKTPARPGIVGEGYGDGKMRHVCASCGIVITKELLSVAKFVKDAKALVLQGVPMPGTVLEPRTGKPEVGPPGAAGNTYACTFPNRMIQRALRGEILELIQPGMSHPPDMESVRRLIESVLTNQSRLKAVEGLAGLRYYHLLPVARICVRKMMSRYWDNSSPFALDLCGAVMRQGIFVEKMSKIDWLHSPSAASTMTRLLKKYTRFFAIMASYPQKVVVPTLDVDLAWHTHQLSPGAYYRYSLSSTSKFIDHDDKIDEGKLSESFEWTSKTYQERFGEVYSECTCWYCETIRASHVSSVGKLLGVSAQDKVSEAFHSSGAANTCPPDKSAHISAHNAIRTEVLESGNPRSSTRKRVHDQLRAAHQRRLDENYAKACRRAEKKGRKLPPKDEYHDHWGYSYYMYAPYYYPMYWTPGMYYGGGPGYVYSGEGAWANCCQGSCGNNGVAAGACGGPGGCGHMGGCGGPGGNCGPGGSCGAAGDGGGGGGFGSCGGGGGGGGGCGGGGGG